KLAERLLDDPPLRAQRGLLVGGAPGGGLHGVDRLAAAALLATDEVDRAPVDERQDPGARLGPLGEEAAGGAPDGEERLLDGVLGEHRVAENPECEPVGDAAVAVVELSERALLATRDQRKEGLVRILDERLGRGGAIMPTG